MDRCQSAAPQNAPPKPTVQTRHAGDGGNRIGAPDVPASGQPRPPGFPLQTLPSVGPNDAYLMLRTAQGDGAAFAHLYQMYFKVVVDFVASRTGSDMPHSDLAQEVFLRVWKNAGRFRGESTVKTYLLGIASKVLLESARSLGRPSAPAIPSTACSYDCASCGVVTESEVAACRQDLERAVARRVAALPPKSRQAIELAALRKLEPPQAAQLAGCSVRAFQMRLRRAIKSLQAALGDGPG